MYFIVFQIRYIEEIHRSHSGSDLQAVSGSPVELHVLGLWDKTRIPRGSLCGHRQNLQTSCRDRTHCPAQSAGQCVLSQNLLVVTSLQPHLTKTCLSLFKMCELISRRDQAGFLHWHLFFKINSFFFNSRTDLHVTQSSWHQLKGSVCTF